MSGDRVPAVSTGYRLSPPQRRLFRLAGDDPGPLRALAALELPPDVEPEALRAALRSLVRTHEILRTRFECPQGARLPLQVVHERDDVAFEERAGGLDALWSAALARPLPLERGPVLHALSSGRVLVLALAAPCADAAALVNISEALERILAGAPAPDEPPLQYADVAAWMDEQASADEARAVAARRAPLQHAAAGLRLGLEQPPAAGAGFAPLTVDVAAPACALPGVSDAALHLAAWALLLARHCGVSAVPVGVVFDGRRHAELRALPGLFARHVPVGISVDERRPFAEFARQVEEELAEAERWSDQIDLDPGDAAAALPFHFERTPAPRALGARLRLLRVHSLGEPFRLRLERSQGGLLRLHGDARSFEPAALEVLAGQYAALLASAAARPAAALGESRLLGAGERRRVVLEWNATEAETPARCVHELFEEQAARTPDRPALACGGERVSYAELDRRADALARRLAQLGVGPETTVGLCLERSIEQVVAVLGVLKAGGAYVPLEPAHPPARRAALLRDVGARVLVLHGRPDFELPGGVTCVQADEQAPGEGRPPSGVVPSNLAYVLYTSGSTGTPKGCLIEHRSLVNYVTWLTRDVLGDHGYGDFSLHSPLGFDFTVTSLYGSLLRGRCLHVQPAALDVDAVLRACLARGSGVDALKLTPSHVRVLAELEPVDSGLRRLITGGEALAPEHVATVRRLLPRAALLNHYGPTEATVGCIAGEVEGGRVTIGRPIANTRVHLLDERGEAAAVGLPAEICVAGAGLARGYHGRPDLTAERFVPDPFGDGGRLYRTGDLGRRLEDGRLEYLGRIDQQVKVRGHRIEPAEIEAALAGHPAVRRVAVAARADAAGHVRLEACVVWQGEAAPDALREHASRLLPDFMLPVRYLGLPELPLTPNGKLDRQALRARLGAAEADERAHVAPRTPAEAQLASVWRDVLGLSRVGVDDNFFELGGDSILAIQVVVRARKLGLELTPRQFFEQPTVARLARLATRPEQPRAEQGLVRGPLPLTPAQARLFALQPGRPEHFNQDVLLDLERERNPRLVDALIERPELCERAVRVLVEHHDALRLRFTRRDGGWEQDNAGFDADAEPAFTLVDLGGVPEDGRARAVTAEAARLQGAFDLARGPLLRMVLFRPGAGAAAQLLCLAHHLVIDGVSWRILLEDFQAVLAQLVAGAAPELPPKTTSFREWSYRLRTQVRRIAPAERAHWSALADFAPSPLPADFTSAGTPRVGDDRQYAARLGAEATRQLLRETADAYATRVDDLLLTALVLSVAEWSGTHRLLLELEGHGRDLEVPAADVSRTVGWFTAHYPVRLDVDPGAGLGRVLRAVKEQLRAVPGGAGFGLLRYGADERARAELARIPRPAVGFNYLGRVDAELRAGAPWRLGTLDTGPEQDPLAEQTQPLALTAAVIDEQLDLSFRYSSAVFRDETVAALARRYTETLAALVAHCRDPHTAGRTPSDFPAARIEQAALDRLLAPQPAAAVRAGRVDIYALTPLQQGLLYHSLWSPDAPSYRGQVSGTLDGPLDGAALRAAWQRVFARHAALRSSFRWRDLDPPVQFAEAEVELPWREIDWSARAVGEGELADLLAAERATPFDLEQAPLSRFLLVRVGAERHHFAWTCHHLLLDGWSSAQVIHEVIALYADPAFEPEPVRPFRDYVSWLQRQDAAAAERFWREELRGFEAPNRLAAPAAGGAAADARYFDVGLELPPEAGSALEGLARSAQVTLNTLVQGAWALVLGHASGRDDVVFGATLAGRPVQLEGVERMVGLFINTLPVRVRLDPRQALVGWLKGLQARQAERDPHAHAALVDVQGWSGLPRGTALFESLVVFENFPAGELPGAGALELREVAYRQQSNYPLTLTVVPGGRLGLVASCDASRFEPHEASALLERVQALLCALPGAADGELGALQARLPPLAAEQAAQREAARRQDNVARLRARRRAAQEAPDAG